MGGKHLKCIVDHADALNEIILSHLKSAIDQRDQVSQVELLSCYYAILDVLDHHHNVLQKRKLNRKLSHLDHSQPNPSIHDQQDPGQPDHTSSTHGDDNQSQSQQSQSQRSHYNNKSNRLIPIILSGLENANSFLMNYWIDYTISFLPFMHDQLPIYTNSIVPHLCSLLRNVVNQQGINSTNGTTCRVLLNGLKHLMNYCVDHSSQHDPTHVISQYQLMHERNHKSDSTSSLAA
ncbi:hypothetical protein AKO1_006135, partial [Acrasis kona]